MWYRHGRKSSAKAFVVFAALAALSACSDNAPIAPIAQAPKVWAPANFTEVGSAIVFRVDNSQGITITLGSHVLSMPAGAICDLQTSGYGPTTWDSDCAPMHGSVEITASIFSGPNGEPYIDFQPAMRFAPGKDVMLFLREGRSDGLKVMEVKYCNAVGYCVDESLNDPSLKPFRIDSTSIVGRRVKHFSGYTIAYGDDCPGEVIDMGDGTYWCEEGGAMRRSGYMVASGEDISDVMKDPQSDDKGNDKAKDQQ